MSVAVVAVAVISPLPFSLPGTSVSVPTEFWSSSSGLICFHTGLGAVALSVRQTPPPETPAQRRQWLALQSGSATIVVTRLAVLLVAPEKEITPGSVAFSVGP